MKTLRGKLALRFGTVIMVPVAIGFIGGSIAAAQVTQPAATGSTTLPNTERSLMPAVSPASTRPSEISPVVAELIETLDDVDPAVRSEAAGKLVAMGRDAFPGLGRAARSDVPQIRLRAIELMRELPWDAADDPPGVSRILSGYGALSVDRRRRIVRSLAMVKGPDAAAASRAMGRILLNDCNDEVLWEVEAQVRLHPKGMNLAVPPQTIAAMSLPMKVIAGRANLRNHPQLGVDLLLQVVNAEKNAEHPVHDREEILHVVMDLVNLARRDHHEAFATQLIRDQYSRATVVQRTSLTRELYALHADAGPLPGWGDDLALRPPNLGDRSTLYAIARMEERRGDGFSGRLIDGIAFYLPLLAQDIRGAKRTNTASERIEVTNFLIQRRWLESAVRELQEVLRNAPEDDLQDHLNAYFHLVTIDRIRGNDQAFADHIKAALDLLEMSPQKMILVGDESTRLLPDEMDNLRATMEMGYFHAAKKAALTTEMQTHAIAIGKLRPVNDQLLLEVYPILKEIGEMAVAQGLFDANYIARKNAMAVAAPDSDPNEANQLAWICAQCDQHLDYAEELAQAAVANAPDNGAFVDTLAEVEFRRGNLDKAVQLETRAIKLLPKEAQIAASLARFQTAANRSASPGPATHPSPREDAGSVNR